MPVLVRSHDVSLRTAFPPPFVQIAIAGNQGCHNPADLLLKVDQRTGMVHA
jgi:hypothetical protein